MKLSMYKFAVGVCAAALAPAAANASATINIHEVGSNVVANGSGSLDLGGLTDQLNIWGLSEDIKGSTAYVGIGDPGTVHGYSGFSGPAAFGSGGLVHSSSSSGTSLGINGSGFGTPYLFVPDGYSGGAISDTATWLGQSFSSLGITPGTYVYVLPNDTLTVKIGGAVGGVPEPATWAMMLFGFGAVGFAVRRAKRRREVPQLA